MNHRVIYEDSRVREAWKLFVDKGMLKREVLRDQIAFSWARSKLSGLSECKEDIELFNEPLVNDFKSLGTDFDDWVIENKYQFVLLDRKYKVLHTVSVKNQWNMLKIKKGDILDEALCGTLASHLTAQTGLVESIVGCEHYLKRFHRFVDLNIPITLNGISYHVWLAKDISEFDPDEITDAIDKVKKICLAIEKEQNKEILMPNSSEDRFIVLISKSGEILKDVMHGDVAFEQDRSIFERTDLTFEKLKSSQTVLVEIELPKDSKCTNEDKFIKYFCEIITSFDEFNILLFKELSTCAELLNLIKGSIANESTNRLSSDHRFKENIYNELKETFSRSAQNSNPVFIYDNSSNTRMEIAYMFFNHSYSNRGKFYTIDCLSNSSNEIEELLFTNDNSRKLGVLDWLGEGILFFDGLSHLEKRIQNKLIQYIETSKNKLGNNLIPRLAFGENKETEKMKYNFSPLILAYSQFNKIELNSNNTVKLDADMMNEMEPELESLEENRTDQIITSDPTVLSIDIKKRNAKQEQFEKSKLFQDNEKALIEKVLYETRYHLTETAKQLGIGRATLYRKIKLYEIKSRS